MRCSVIDELNIDGADIFPTTYLALIFAERRKAILWLGLYVRGISDASRNICPTNLGFEGGPISIDAYGRAMSRHVVATQPDDMSRHSPDIVLENFRCGCRQNLCKRWKATVTREGKPMRKCVISSRRVLQLLLSPPDRRALQIFETSARESVPKAFGTSGFVHLNTTGSNLIFVTLVCILRPWPELAELLACVTSILISYQRNISSFWVDFQVQVWSSKWDQRHFDNSYIMCIWKHPSTPPEN